MAYPESPMEDDVAYPCKGCDKVTPQLRCPWAPASRAVDANDSRPAGRYWKREKRSSWVSARSPHQCWIAI